MKAIYQIDAPHFCCGIVVEDKTKIVEAAPVIAWAYRKTAKEVFTYFLKKGYKVTKIEKTFD